MMENKLPKLWIYYVHSLLTQLIAHEEVMASDFICDLGFDIKILNCYDHYKISLNIPGIILTNHYFKIKFNNYT